MEFSEYLKHSSKGSLKDLKAEEKAKIGTLMTRLASETSERKSIEVKRKKDQRRFKKLQKQNKKLAADCEDLNRKFTKSLQVIKHLQNNESMRMSELRESSPPIVQTPEKFIRNIGTQTVEDKSFQTEALPMTPQKLRRTKSTAQRYTAIEAKNLKSEIAYLSQSIKNLRGKESKESSSKGSNQDHFVFSKGPSLQSSFALDTAPNFYSAATSGQNTCRNGQSSMMSNPIKSPNTSDKKFTGSVQSYNPMLKIPRRRTEYNDDLFDLIDEIEYGVECEEYGYDMSVAESKQFYTMGRDSLPNILEVGSPEFKE